jgi:hypothetical protein
MVISSYARTSVAWDNLQAFWTPCLEAPANASSMLWNGPQISHGRQERLGCWASVIMQVSHLNRYFEVFTLIVNKEVNGGLLHAVPRASLQSFLGRG